jgi:hypothetical protein
MKKKKGHVKRKSSMTNVLLPSDLKPVPYDVGMEEEKESRGATIELKRSPSDDEKHRFKIDPLLKIRKPDLLGKNLKTSPSPSQTSGGITGLFRSVFD